MTYEEELKQIRLQISELRERESEIEDKREAEVEAKLREVKYWQSSQDYYFVTDHETFHVSNYAGGGGLGITTGFAHELFSIHDYTISSKLEPSTKEVFDQKLKEQLDRIQEAIDHPEKPSWR